MTGLIFAAVVLAAAGVWVWRGAQARATRRRHREGPGTSVEQAILVRSFADMDHALAARRCHCGESLRATGEGTRQGGERRYRFTRLACDECEETSVLFFDVTEVLH